MNLTPAMLLVASLCGYAIGAVGGVLSLRRERLANGFCFSGAAFSSLSGLAAALLFLAGGVGQPTPQLELFPPLLPYIHFSVRLDALSVFFLLLVSLLGLTISIYSLGYAKGFFGRKNVGVLGAFFNALLLATTLVVTADNLWLFLIAWELMALTAYCLVSYEHESAETRQSGVLYFIMSHIDAGCITLGFLLLCQASGDDSFARLHDLGGKMAPGGRDAAFVLFLVGFGIKAGIVPLHIWLPAAHPVAPSNVSAFMSGVLIKTGIYGLTRVCFDFLGAPPLWWGVAVLTVGTVSAVLGVRYALMEHDLKRLLAYHSLENIGIILMGLGAALVFLHTGHPLLATLGLIAGLFHTINHASFKGLLFLGAGRASGFDHDLRRDFPHDFYDQVQFSVPVFTEGDVQRRFDVRRDEVIQSLAILHQVMEKLPAGPISVTVGEVPSDRVALGYVEGWRGEIFHWIHTAPGNRLVRCKVKDPSLQNWPALSEAILGNIVPDFPVVNKSFNLSYSGTDR